MGLCSNRLHGWGMVVTVVIILLSQGSLRNFRCLFKTISLTYFNGCCMIFFPFYFDNDIAYERKASLR